MKKIITITLVFLFFTGCVEKWKNFKKKFSVNTTLLKFCDNTNKIICYKHSEASGLSCMRMTETDKCEY